MGFIISSASEYIIKSFGSAFFKPLFPNNRSKVSEHNKFRAKLTGESDDQYELRCVNEFEEEVLRIGPERVAGFVLALKVAAMKALILVMTMAAIKVWLADPVVLMKGRLASSW